jgi:hypothetical protein
MPHYSSITPLYEGQIPWFSSASCLQSHVHAVTVSSRNPPLTSRDQATMMPRELYKCRQRQKVSSVVLHILRKVYLIIIVFKQVSHFEIYGKCYRDKYSFPAQNAIQFRRGSYVILYGACSIINNSRYWNMLKRVSLHLVSTVMDILKVSSLNIQ